MSILEQGNAGLSVKNLCRQAGISSATDDQWKSKYGGLEASDLGHVRELEARPFEGVGFRRLPVRNRGAT